MTARRPAAAAVATPARPSGDELLAQMSPTKRRADTWVCLSGQLLEDWTVENEKLEAMRAEELAKRSGGNRLSAGGAASAEVKAQARKVQKLEEQVDKQQMHFVFENMSPDEQSALEVLHPPRKGDQFDALAGYDRDAVSRASVRECLVEPVFSDEGWARLMEVIPPGEWKELQNTCNRANGRVVSLPKSQLAASLLRSRNGASSSSPEAGE